ncbi:hypothetical protein H9S92_18385 [Lewinella lacunae]|uniref:Uncharacterized protein n=1 Tax=Neolewinella lacunae TaxID=1517758 RepID=A0A923T8Y8_9BACT|nr:hypothetical protein [Neolewinella lacunae]
MLQRYAYPRKNRPQKVNEALKHTQKKYKILGSTAAKEALHPKRPADGTQQGCRGGVSKTLLAMPIHHQAVDQIRQHMEQEANPDQSERPAQEKEYHVPQHCIVSMQGVKMDAATVRLKNGVGQQVIQIHQHGRQQQQISPFPILPKAEKGDEKRESEMQEIVNEGLHSGKIVMRLFKSLSKI